MFVFLELLSLLSERTKGTAERGRRNGENCFASRFFFIRYVRFSRPPTTHSVVPVTHALLHRLLDRLLNRYLPRTALHQIEREPIPSVAREAEKGEKGRGDIFALQSRRRGIVRGGDTRKEGGTGRTVTDPRPVLPRLTFPVAGSSRSDPGRRMSHGKEVRLWRERSAAIREKGKQLARERGEVKGGRGGRKGGKGLTELGIVVSADGVVGLF